MIRGDTGRPGGGERNAGLDLLRAAAILMVLASHFGIFATAIHLGRVPLGFLVPGFLGVELFYVLSGFLIGNLLLSAVERGPTPEALRVFLVRRWMRTVPAYLLWGAVLLVVLPPPGDALRRALAFATFTQNLAWPMPADNWFAVSWSLAVEEWFYLLFGASLFLAVTLAPRAGFWIGLALFLCAPFAARLLVSGGLPWDAAIRKVVALRLDAIAYGVLAARLLRHNRVPRGWGGPACCLGLGMLAALWWFLSSGSGFEVSGTFRRAAVFNWATVGFALLFPLALRFSGGGRGLRAAAEWISLRAYGLYLVHFSLLELVARHLSPGWPSAGGLVAALLGSFVLADLSWRFVEKPILLRRPPSAEQAVA